MSIRIWDLNIDLFRAAGLDVNGDDVKQRLLDASLRYVPSEGWTKDALVLGAKDLRYPDVVHGLFHDVGSSLVQHYIRTMNNRLVEHLKSETANRSQGTKIHVRSFIGDSVKYRLKLNIPYLDRLPEALSIALRPDRLPESSSSLLRMCDEIWYYAGDRSVDMTWYTKRASLATIYGAIELYMIQDKSADFEDTWRFMDRRFHDLRNLTQVYTGVSLIGDLAYSFYVLGRNVIGASTESRNR